MNRKYKVSKCSTCVCPHCKHSLTRHMAVNRKIEDELVAGIGVISVNPKNSGELEENIRKKWNLSDRNNKVEFY